MTPSPAPPSTLQRWIIGLIGAVVIALTVTWMINIYYIQLLLIAGVLALLLEGLFIVALLRQGVRWLLSRRGVVFVGWVLAGLASLVVLFYAEENWRGRRAWASVVREAAARGESLEFSSVFPPAVREDDNLVRTPGISNLLANPTWDNLIQRPGDGWPEANWGLGQFTDLSAWRERLLNPPGERRRPGNQSPPPTEPSGQAVAANVLRDFDRFEPEFQVLRRAAERPGNRFDVDYAQGLFAKVGWGENPYEPLARAAELLCIRASAQLVLNRPEPALEDVLLALRLGDCLRREPFWYAHHRWTEVLMHVLQPVWEGMAMRRWTEPQLLSLQQRFGELDVIGDLRWSLRGETMVMMNLADQFQAWRGHKPSALGEQIAGSSGSERVSALLARAFYPTGWLYQDKAWMYRFYMEFLPGVNAARPDWFDDSEVRARMLRVTDPMLLIFVVPRFREMFHYGRERGLYLNAATGQAILACTLDRYRLANGKYPVALQELVPGFLKELPTDPLGVSGRSYNYRPAQDGYAIYSIGLNLADDGGKPSPARTHWQGGQYLFPEVEKGDWVWRQPGAK